MRRTVFATTMVVLAVSLVFGASPAPAAPPANDEFSSATVIPALPYSDVVDTSEATSSPDDPDCFPGSPTVWYAFTPATDMRVSANTVGSDFDTTLAVVTGSPGAFTVVACNDDFGSLQSAVVFEAQAGVTYYIVGGSCCGPGASGGTLHLNVQQAGPPLEAQVSVDSRATVDRFGTATLTGTISCNQPATGNMYVVLRQYFANRVLISGEAFSPLSCTPPGSAFEVSVAAFNGRFSAGKAQVDVFWDVCSPTAAECTSGNVTTNLTLRRGGP